MFYRFFVYFDGKVVGVAEEEETLSRVFIGAHFLVRDPGLVQIYQHRVKIVRYLVASSRDSVRSFCNSSAPTVPSRTIVVHVFLFIW